MSDSSKAVFLSYASQDAEAAKRICESLRQAGVEVWFDQSELVGGDAWDQKIRKQIRECALFVPLISANTNARLEGYYRLEWKLAIDRSHLMAEEKTFLVPVVIDETVEPTAKVPDRFRDFQWTRLDLRETPASLAERIAKLVGGEMEPGRHGLGERGPFGELRTGEGAASPSRKQGSRWQWWMVFPVVGVLVSLGFMVLPLWHAFNRPAEPAAKPVVANSPLSPARERVERARAILSKGSLTRAQLDAANELCEEALRLDRTDAIVWAAAARSELVFIYPYGYDLSAERRKRAQERATRAFDLAPEAYDVRVAYAKVLAHAVGTPALIAEAEKTFHDLIKSYPDDKQLVVDLAEVLREARRFDEAAKLFESVGQFEVAGWSYFQSGDLRAALAAVNRAQRAVTALQLTAMLEFGGNGDLVAAQAAIDRMQPSELLAEMPATIAMRVAMYRRDPERMLELARGLSRDYIDSNGFRGPRGYFTGLAHQMAGRTPQAEAEWRSALAVVESMRKTAPDDRQLLLASAWLHAALKDMPAAEATFARSQALAGLSGDTLDFANCGVLLGLRKKEALLAGAEQYFRTKQPLWHVMHADLRFSPEADFLRDDPRFEKLLRDYPTQGTKPSEGPTLEAKR